MKDAELTAKSAPVVTDSRRGAAHLFHAGLGETGVAAFRLGTSGLAGSDHDRGRKSDSRKLGPTPGAVDPAKRRSRKQLPKSRCDARRSPHFPRKPVLERHVVILEDLRFGLRFPIAMASRRRATGLAAIRF